MPSIELTLYQPNAAPRTLRFDADTITLGRTKGCTVAIEDRHLSRKHAEIQFDGGAWVLRDHESVNGTFLNGTRVRSVATLKDGDRIKLGAAEVVFGKDQSPSRPMSSGSMRAVPAVSLLGETAPVPARDTIVQELAMELLEDRPMSELFDIIADAVIAVLRPSRFALALLVDGGAEAVQVVKLRRSDLYDSTELAISKTLLHEVVTKRNIVSFTDTEEDEFLAEAQSIVGQAIRSAVCAPLLGAGSVLGVLYIDYRRAQAIADGDVKLVAQIARIAAIKLESTQLREAALERE